MPNDDLDERNRSVHRVEARGGQWWAGLGVGKRNESLAAVLACESNATAGATAKGRERAFQISLRVDRQLRRERLQSLPQFDPRTQSASAIELDHAIEAWHAFEQGGELPLHDPSDPSRRVRGPQRMKERQGKHDVAEVRQPDDDDALRRSRCV